MSDFLVAAVLIGGVFVGIVAKKPPSQRRKGLESAQTKCGRVPTPVGVDPLVGCYWGEPGAQTKRRHADADEGKKQSALF